MDCGAKYSRFHLKKSHNPGHLVQKNLHQNEIKYTLIVGGKVKGLAFWMVIKVNPLTAAIEIEMLLRNKFRCTFWTEDVHAAVQQIFYNNAAGLHTKSRF
jgi:hypothetical protein